MKLLLDLSLKTDGDFGLNNIESLFDLKGSMYKGADVEYSCNCGGEDIYVRLRANGDANACRWAARDLMENLVCNIRTHKYYVIKYLYDLIITPKEQLLWSGENVNYLESIGGNYEGTYIQLIIFNEYDAKDKTPEPNTQLWIETAECGGAAMYGEDGKWYWTFDGEKKDECKLNVLRWGYL